MFSKVKCVLTNLLCNYIQVLYNFHVLKDKSDKKTM